MGFSEERGDQLTVESLPFDSTLNSDPPPQPAPVAPPSPKQNFDIKTLLGNRNVLIGAGAGGGLLLVSIAFLIWKRRRKKKVQVVEPGALPSPIEGVVVDVSQEAKALEENAAAVHTPLALSASKTEQQLTDLRERAVRDAPLLAALLQEWMAEEPVVKT